MNTTQVEQPASETVPTKRAGIIDCDVHPDPRSADEINARMPHPYKGRFKRGGRGFFHNPVRAARLDSKPPNGGAPGSDPEFMRQQHLNEFGIAHVILLPRIFCSMDPDPDFGTALAAACNDWLAETWLSQFNADGAFKGSIMIAHQDPLAAAREIERWAGNPHFAQVMTHSGARAPFGQRQYYPIYEACAKHNLPFAIHPGTEGMGINDQPSPGYPTHYIEWHASLPLAIQAHLVSLLTEGVFEKFPDFRVVLVEGGVAWLPSLLWRLDAYWKALRTEIPWVKQRPSAYLRDHVRLTSQPLERPDSDQQLLQLLDMMDAEHILMFSSDYPHWDFDSPKRAFPKLPDRAYQRIFETNAREWYGL